MGTIGTPITSSPLSYVTVFECEEYFANLLYSGPWDSATEEDKNKAIVTATQIIDSLNYADDKTEDDQELEFPRGTDTTVPQAIKDACAEIALALLDGYDIEQGFRTQNIKSTSYSGVSTTYDINALPEYAKLGIPSVRAWRLLRPYIEFNAGISISRVN